MHKVTYSKARKTSNHDQIVKQHKSGRSIEQIAKEENLTEREVRLNLNWYFVHEMEGAR